jgi:hypothetical protein
MDLALYKVIVMESILWQDLFDIVDRLPKSDVLCGRFSCVGSKTRDQQGDLDSVFVKMHPRK